MIMRPSGSPRPAAHLVCALMALSGLGACGQSTVAAGSQADKTTNAPDTPTSTATTAAVCAAPGTKNEPSGSPTATPEQADTVAALTEVLFDPAEFLTRPDLAAVVTGTVSSATLNRQETSLDPLTTMVALDVEKSTNPEDIAVGATAKIWFHGGRTTIGQIPEVAETKELPPGEKPEPDKKLAPDTPKHFSFNGLVPPKAGDRLLLFVAAPTGDVPFRYVLGSNTGTFLAATTGGQCTKEIVYTGQGRHEGYSGTLTVSSLNTMVEKLRRENGDAFRHRPL